MLSDSCVWLRSDIYVATQTEVSWDKVGKRSVDAWISCNDYGDIAIEAHLLVRFGEVIAAIMQLLIDRKIMACACVYWLKHCVTFESSQFDNVTVHKIGIQVGWVSIYPASHVPSRKNGPRNLSSPSY